MSKKDVPTQCFRFDAVIPIGSMPESEFASLHTTIIDFLAETCQDYIFQLERGAKEGKLHYQLYFKKTPPKIRARTLAILWNDRFPGISVRAASSDGLLALKSYVIKSDTREAGPWGMRPIYTGTDLDCMKKPNPFQEKIIALVKTKANDRDIHYFYEPKGGVGKSKLVKYLCFNKLACRIPMGNATQLKTFVCQAGAHSAFVIDIPRTTGQIEKLADLYSAIEEVKNGFVQSPMYGKLHQLYMDPPHVLVFSNKPPVVSVLSKDKWKIGKISYNKTFKHHYIDWKDAKDFVKKKVVNKKRKLSGEPSEPKKFI